MRKTNPNMGCFNLPLTFLLELLLSNMPIVATKAFPLRDIERWLEKDEVSKETSELFSNYEIVWFISILDPDRKKVLAPGENTICFEFCDYDLDHIDEDTGKNDWEGFEFPEGVLFSTSEAKRMVAFIQKAHADPRRGLLAVHCHAGISRSGAVATFIQEAYKLNKQEFEVMNPYIVPNEFVRRLLQEALNLENSKV